MKRSVMKTFASINRESRSTWPRVEGKRDRGRQHNSHAAFYYRVVPSDQGFFETNMFALWLLRDRSRDHPPVVFKTHVGPEKSGSGPRGRLDMPKGRKGCLKLRGEKNIYLATTTVAKAGRVVPLVLFFLNSVESIEGFSSLMVRLVVDQKLRPFEQK